MDFDLNIIIVVLMGVFMMGSQFLLLRHFSAERKMDTQIKIKLKNRDITLPMRLQAHERLILLMERITPENLVFRVHKPGMTALMLQTELLKTIRTEFDHNTSQQLYTSVEVWQMIKKTKEEIIKLINLSADQMKESSTSMDLCKVILKYHSQYEKTPVSLTQMALKKEVRALF